MRPVVVLLIHDGGKGVEIETSYFVGPVCSLSYTVHLGSGLSV